MMAQLSKQKTTDRHGKQVDQESFNSIYMMADSGARGSAAQIRQLAGHARPDASRTGRSRDAHHGELREGLNVLQYLSPPTAPARAWRTRALKTRLGLSTRRLVDVTKTWSSRRRLRHANGMNMRALSKAAK